MLGVRYSRRLGLPLLSILTLFDPGTSFLPPIPIEDCTYLHQKKQKNNSALHELNSALHDRAVRLASLTVHFPLAFYLTPQFGQSNTITFPSNVWFPLISSHLPGVSVAAIRTLLSTSRICNSRLENSSVPSSKVTWGTVGASFFGTYIIGRGGVYS